MTTQRCSRCGHEWESVRDNPIRCPGCGSYRWREEPVRRRCAVCGHEWASRGSGIPQRCPLCKTRRWEDGEAGHHPGDAQESSRRREEDEVSAMYGEGRGCLDISIATDIPLERVVRIVRSRFPEEHRTRM